ncbi:hypothetical protein [Martelella mediterranea]|uniref:hypothetical protein n=1 Tax=Martelella mediterranea TaxID=293089 RepID=UPI003AB02621
MATGLNQSRSGRYRTLLELASCGYVQQSERGNRRLTTKMPAMGINWLSKSGLVELPSRRRAASPNTRVNWCASQLSTVTG